MTSFELQYQRELNRVNDADRMTRKRGLQKLFESLPWEKKETRSQLLSYLDNVLAKAIVPAIADPVEKCREFTLRILHAYSKIWQDVPEDLLMTLIFKLCERMNTLPYPEVAEELRLMIIEVLHAAVAKLHQVSSAAIATNNNALFEQVILVILKGLPDNYPAAKRAIADFFIFLCTSCSSRPSATQSNRPILALIIKSHAKSIMKALQANTNHQHSKTRNITLHAMGRLLSLQAESNLEGYEGLLLSEGTALATWQKALTDRSAIVRSSLANSLSSLITTRTRQCLAASRGYLTVDLEVICLLVLLTGDTVQEVSLAAKEALTDCLKSYQPHLIPYGTRSEHSMLVEGEDDGELQRNNDNAELTLAAAASAASMASPTTAAVQTMEVAEPSLSTNLPDGSSSLSSFIALYAKDLLAILLARLSNQWTVEQKLLSIHGLTQFIHLLAAPLLARYLSNILEFLYVQTRDEAAEIRQAIEDCCQVIGAQCSNQQGGEEDDGEGRVSKEAWLELVLPRIRGELYRPRQRQHRQQRSAGGGNSSTMTSIAIVEEEGQHHQLSNQQAVDNVYARTQAIRVATFLWKGSHTSKAAGMTADVVEEEARCLLKTIQACIQPSLLLNYRDIMIKEALLLLVRVLIDQYATLLTATLSATATSTAGRQQPKQLSLLKMEIEKRLAVLLLHLLAKIPSEYDDAAAGVISNLAKKELLRLAKLATTAAAITATGKPSAANEQQSVETEELLIIEQFLTPYFTYLYCRIFDSPAAVSNSNNNKINKTIMAANTEEEEEKEENGLEIREERERHRLFLELLAIDSVDISSWTDREEAGAEQSIIQKATWEELLRLCITSTWQYWDDLVYPLLRQLATPQALPSHGSTEYHMQQYAAQRGEDDQAISARIHQMIDSRLAAMVLVEYLIRTATTQPAYWTCGSKISQVALPMLTSILMPNLTWRIGKVEATIRKISLATCYALLKAGAVTPQVLTNIAQMLVPLLINHLDDAEISPRMMAALSLSVIFHRLGAIFSQQSIHEMYPKIIARLDDSSDEVRVAACTLLEKFLLCGVDKYCYTGTIIDYILDQAFIHLDDPNPAIQEAVYMVIITAAKQVDKGLVLKKAEANRVTHRSPVLCDKLIIEVTGVELLT